MPRYAGQNGPRNGPRKVAGKLLATTNPKGDEMNDQELPDGFRPGDPTAHDRATTDHTGVTFTLKEGQGGVPRYAIEEDAPGIGILKHEVAEKKAELPKLDGALWHAHRRGWATSRKHMPVSDVAAVGGWKDIGTLLKCYTQADSDTMLAVMASPKKRARRRFPDNDSPLFSPLFCGQNQRDFPPNG